MPIIKSAAKRARQATVHRKRNVALKRTIKEATKAFLAKPSAATLSAAHSRLDTARKKGLLKANAVARRKSALSRIAKSSGVKLTPAKKAPAKTATKPAVKKPVTKKAPAKKTPTKKAPAKKPVAKK